MAVLIYLNLYGKRWLGEGSHSLNENIFDFIHDMNRKEIRYLHVEFVQRSARNEGMTCTGRRNRMFAMFVTRHVRNEGTMSSI